MLDSHGGQKVQCKSCTEEIFQNSRLSIRCAECEDLDLCLECFSARVELGSHRPDHCFKLIDNLSFSLFGTEWTACEHLRLLNAVEQYGYGNFEDIARYLNNAGTNETSSSTNWSKKTSSQAKEEFSEVFLNGTIGKYTWRDDQRGRAHDHTIDNFLTPQVASETPTNLSMNEAIMLGYFPKRDDFEVEFDNEAENLVAQIEDYQTAGSNACEMTAEDEELESALKLAHIDMYKTKLRERERRKKVARDYQLISNYFKENPLSSDRKNQVKPRKPPKDPILEKLKIWAELLGVKEHQNLMVTVAKERDIKNKIKDLNRFRKNGISTLSDAQEYENQRIRRSQKRKFEKKKLLQQQLSGNLDAAELLALSPPNSVKSDDLSNGSYSSPFQLSPMPNHQVPVSEKPQASTIERLQGYEILSSNEKKLCSNLRLTPAHYISYKTCLLANHLQKKKGQTPKPLNPSGLDKNNRKIIFNFLMRAGWITAY